MNTDFYRAIEDRRSIYVISKEAVIPDKKILEIVNHAVKYCPSAFNSQGSRVVVLLNKHHDKLWDITIEALRKIVPQDKFAPTEDKINSFKNGYGTVLFFEDESTIKSLQEQFKSYKDNFPVWAQQTSGMLQYVIWTAFEFEGFGVSLQHYNPIIDDEVKKEWNIPDNWNLIAQLPFGKPTEPAGEKEFLPLENRVKLFK